LAPGRGDNLLFFRTYQGDSTNEYFLEVKNNQYFLRNDTLQYASPLTARNIGAHVAALHHQLDSLNIRSYDGEPNGLGILLELYLKDGKTVFHALDTSQITDTATLNSIKKAERLCKDWYLGEY
jgi:hypothetical protein